MSEFKERFKNKLIRKFNKTFVSAERMAKRAYDLGQFITNSLDAEFEGEYTILNSGAIAIFTGNFDEDKENVLATAIVDIYGKQVRINVNEAGDYLGIGRSLKKLLEGKGFHVYYTNVEMAIINNMLAIGTTAIRQITIATHAGETNETIH